MVKAKRTLKQIINLSNQSQVLKVVDSKVNMTFKCSKRIFYRLIWLLQFRQ